MKDGKLTRLHTAGLVRMLENSLRSIGLELKSFFKTANELKSYDLRIKRYWDKNDAQIVCRQVDSETLNVFPELVPGRDPTQVIVFSGDQDAKNQAFLAWLQDEGCAIVFEADIAHRCVFSKKFV